VDILKVDALSTEEIATQAGNLYDHWRAMQPEEKREIVETIAEKIVIGKNEINISFYYAPSSKDMANRRRKGWDSNPTTYLDPSLEKSRIPRKTTIFLIIL
jgi:hypothetical protein